MNEQENIGDIYYRRFSERTSQLRESDFQWQWIQRAIGKNKIKDALDLGCGAGTYSHAISQTYRIHVSAVDLFDNLPEERSDSQVTYIQGSADSIPLSESSVDFVIALSSLYYLDNPAEVIAEICRVLRPGGTTVISGHTLYSIPTLWRRLRILTGSGKMAHLSGVRFRDVSYYTKALKDNGMTLRNIGGFFQHRQLNKHYGMGIQPQKGAKLPLVRYLHAHFNYHFILTAEKAR